MAELMMVKRRAQPGEFGLFPAGEVFEEEWQTLKMDGQFNVTATAEAHPKYNRLSWHIANLVKDSTEQFEYADEARDHILIECRHYRKVFNKLKHRPELVPKATRKLDQTAWLKLIKRMVHVATTQYGIPESEISRNADYPQALAAVDPPPHDVIPDGPGAHLPPAEEPQPEHRPDPEPPIDVDSDDNKQAALEREWSQAAAEDRAGEQDAAPVQPEPEPKRARKPKAAAEPDIGPEPPWPTDVPSYVRFVMWHHDKHTDQAGFIVFFNSDEQWKLRQACGVGLMTRKEIEARFVDKFPMFAPVKK